MRSGMFIQVAQQATDCDGIRFAALVQAVETQQPVTYVSHCKLSVVVAPEEARVEILQYSGHRLRRLVGMPARIESERLEHLKSVQEELNSLLSVLQLCRS